MAKTVRDLVDDVHQAAVNRGAGCQPIGYRVFNQPVFRGVCGSGQPERARGKSLAAGYRRRMCVGKGRITLRIRNEQMRIGLSHFYMDSGYTRTWFIPGGRKWKRSQRFGNLSGHLRNWIRTQWSW